MTSVQRQCGSEHSISSLVQRLTLVVTRVSISIEGVNVSRFVPDNPINYLRSKSLQIPEFESEEMPGIIVNLPLKTGQTRHGCGERT